MADTAGGGKKGHKHPEKIKEMAEIVRTYLYLTGQPTPHTGGKRIWEGVKRRMRSGRTVGALRKALCEWKRFHPVEWDAAQRAAESDPSNYFKGLYEAVNRQTGTHRVVDPPKRRDQPRQRRVAFMTAATETAEREWEDEHPHQPEEDRDGGDEMETDEIEVVWEAKSIVGPAGSLPLPHQLSLPATPPAVPTPSVAAGVPDGQVPLVSGGDGPSHMQRGRSERRRAPLRQLACPCCLRLNSFGSAHQLEMHLARTHFPCRPYPCSDCDGLDRFSTEQELREHYQLGHSLVKGEFQVTYSPADEREAFAYSQVKRVLKMVLDEAGQGGSG